MKNILIVLIGLSTLMFADFSKSGDIVTDNVTKLQWQDNSDANETTKSWEEAIAYCEGLTLGGFEDWRMPNINELLSIADKNKAAAPAISDVFEYVAYTPNNLTLYTVVYWSSTTSLYNDYWGEDRAYTVNFNYGDEVDYYPQMEKSHANYIRCVRGGL